MAVLIRDIAERVGVSEATVSMALRNRSEISKARRNEIQALAKKMNYRPNRMAQGLARGKTKTLGLIIGTLQQEVAQQKAVYMDAIASKAGYKLFISYSKAEYERTLQLAEELIACGVDGLFIAGNNINETNGRDKAGLNFGVPTVFIDSIMPMGFRFNRVVHDKSTGVEQAIDELCKLGHRNIYMLHSCWDYWWTDSRFTGFSNGFERNNLADVDDHIYKIYDKTFPADYVGVEAKHNNETVQNVKNFLKLHPDCTAIICSSDSIAISIMTVLQRLGIKIPEDISIVGIDNIQLAQIIHPSLSSISQSIDLVVDKSFNIMMECLATPARAPEKIVIPTRFIMRNSCAPVKS